MKELWEYRYKNFKIIPTYDNWLDRYNKYLKNNCRLLEIGVGCGPNIEEYRNIDFKNIYVCDFSFKALELLKLKNNKINIFQHDIRNEFNFMNEYFDIIISDLSLHYFDNITTKSIIAEMHRLLKTSGLFLLRMNAIGDYNSSYKKGIEIEKEFFKIGNNYKRFFNRKMLLEYFNDWKCVSIEKNITFKYGFKKQCIVGLFKKMKIL